MNRPKGLPKTRQPAASSSAEGSLGPLRRETKTALELAVVALAPAELLDRLAVVAGLLEALAGLPSNSPPALAMAPGLVKRAREALVAWRTWQEQTLGKRLARG